MHATFRILLGLLCVAMAAAGATAGAAAGELTVYSGRKDHLVKPLLDAYSAKTGVPVRLVSADADQLIERLRREGADSPADVLITVDAGRLDRAVAEGLLQPVESAVLDANIPAHLRDPGRRWFGLSQHARVVFYAKERVEPQELSTYEDLAAEKWRGRICVRSSASVYNQSLMAALMAAMGNERAEAWARGIVANQARKPRGGDRDQLRAVAAGECDLAIANTYYYGAMLGAEDPVEMAAAQKLGVFFPDQQGRGAQVNISGAGVTAASRNRDAAVRLLEFLSGDDAQRIYAEVNQEYPVKPDVAWSPLVERWGRFKADELHAHQRAANYAQAIKLFERARWR